MKDKRFIFVALIFSGITYVVLTSQSKQQTSPIRSLLESPTPTTYQITDTLDTTKWKSYTNQRFGFSIRYPADLDVTPTEVDIQTAQQTYINNCESGRIDGCGGSRWPDYQIAFLKPNKKSAFDMVIHVVPVAEFLGGEENNGFTFQVRTAGMFADPTEYDPVDEQTARTIEQSLRFITPTKPLACLWTGKFVGVDINKQTLEYRAIYKKASGYFYNSGKNTCEAINLYTWVEDGKTPEQSANIPFSSPSDCQAACVTEQ